MRFTDSAANTLTAHHRRRINRVIDHIGTHLDDALDLAALAGVAHFSPWHFHRIFQAMTGETPAGHVRRARLEAAAARLLRRPRESALSIALGVGFGSAEAFTRAFSAQFGTTPSAWRRGGGQRHADARAGALRAIRLRLRKANQDAARRLAQDRQYWPVGAVIARGIDMQIELKSLPAMRLAYLRHTGPYGQPSIPETWARFNQWREKNGLLNPGRLSMGIGQDNPAITPPEKLRYDCCVQVDDDFTPARDEQLPIGVQPFAAGRFACVRYAGMGHDLGQAWDELYRSLLPKAGHVAADRPGVDLYDESFTLDAKTGAFTCWLCAPIKA